MDILSLSDWRSVADRDQRAYLAQTAALHGLLEAELLPGWTDLAEVREVHALLADHWPTVQWPALCGPAGHSVSRFVPSLRELRMAPQDLNVLSYSHELAHALGPQHGHSPVWAEQQLEVLRVMYLETQEHAVAEARLTLAAAYQQMEVTR